MVDLDASTQNESIRMILRVLLNNSRINCKRYVRKYKNRFVFILMIKRLLYFRIERYKD